MSPFTAYDYQLFDPGEYPAEFLGVEDSPEPGPFGPTVEVLYAVMNATGPVEVSELASKPEQLTKGTKLRQRLEAILGRPMGPGEMVDPSTLRGTKVLLTLTVKTTETGQFNRVANVRRLDPYRPPAPQQPPAVDPEYLAWRAARDAEQAALEATGAEEPLPPEPSGDDSMASS